MHGVGGWIDRFTAPVAPRWTLRRQRARAAAEVLLRYYEGASHGRRTSGWRRPSTDANAAAANGRALLRDQARDLVRNNAWAVNALNTIVDHAIGWGITATSSSPAALAAWKEWAETTACDADGRQDLAGLEKQVMRTTAEAGEVLVRRRWRQPKDGLPVPLQLQVLEPDYLDTSKDFGVTLRPDGATRNGALIQGVQFDAIGNRVGYWMFDDHPGSSTGRGLTSRFIPATEILHIFRPERPGLVRGVSWFASVLLLAKDLDDYEDAALVKQKIAACLAVITTDPDGTAPTLGKPSTDGVIDSLEPGMILNSPVGRNVTVVQPPQVNEHGAYVATVLRKWAAGVGLTYEDLTGNYENLPFSAARMSRLRHWARVEDWRWRMIVPQFCDPVWRWFLEAAAVVQRVPDTSAVVRWTAPPMPMLEPDKEGLAYERNIRNMIMTLPEAIRERGYDPDVLLKEAADFFAKCEAAGLVLDCNPRQTTQQGQMQATFAPAGAAGTDTARSFLDALREHGKLVNALVALSTNGHRAEAPTHG